MTIAQMEASVINIRELAAERDELRALVAKLTDANALLTSDLKAARQLAEKWLADRDHAMRAQAELMAQVTAAAAVLHDATMRAARSGYRPNGAAPKGDGVHGEPGPGFLRRIEHDASHPRRGA